MDELLVMLVDFAWGAAWVALGFVVLTIAKYARGLATPYPMSDHLLKSDNPALGLANVGYMLGVVIIFLGATIAPAPIERPGVSEILRDMGIVVAWSVGGIVLLHIGLMVTDRLVLSKFSVTKELLEDRNVGTGAVVAGGCVATALVIAGAIHGRGGGVVTALAFFAAGQAVFVLFARFYQMVTRYDVHGEIEKDNVAAGVAFGLNLAALGVILLRGVSGDFVGWTDNFLDFAYYAIGGTLLLGVLRRVTDFVFIEKTTIPKEIVEDRNVNAAWLEGTVALGVGAMVFFLM